MRTFSELKLASVLEENNAQRQERIHSSPQHSYTKSVLPFALIVFLFVVLKNAWLGDDSYITFRTVDNVIHGYGLTWNTDERVQAFTHPLWMFLVTVADFCVRDIYFAALGLSLLVTGLAVGIFTFRLADKSAVGSDKSAPTRRGSGVVGGIVGLAALTFSKAFIDYSTSGLENPLTHLLIVLFVLVFFTYQSHKRYVLWLSLLSCMMILNRMDTVLLFMPALLYTLYKFPTLKTIKTMALSFFPFMLWELFSLFYYGFLFPNTAYAKLNTGIASSELLRQGIAYLVSSFNFDPLLLIILLAAVVLVFTYRDWKSMPLVVGMALYIFYTVKIGGDFMAGRFLTAPFLMAVILLVRNMPPSPKVYLVVVLATIVAFGLWVPDSRVYAFSTTPYDKHIDARGVADEHLAYANYTGLINFRRGLIPDNDWAEFGLQARQNHWRVLIETNMGYLGFMAGPHVHIVDRWALTEPLLAHLPVQPGEWVVGHFERKIPDGYMETIESGRNHIKDKNLALYYSKLHYIISGPLFDWQRFVEIWNINIGAYDFALPPKITSPSPYEDVN